MTEHEWVLPGERTTKPRIPVGGIFGAHICKNCRLHVGITIFTDLYDACPGSPETKRKWTDELHKWEENITPEDEINKENLWLKLMIEKSNSSKLRELI